jgi:hypothetical protein
MLLLRRAGAITVDYTLVFALCAIGLWWDSRTSWLYGYDSSYLGALLLVSGILGTECLLFTSPGKAVFRLRIVSDGQIRPYRIQIFLRGLLFWTLLLSPGTFLPSSLPLISFRSDLIVQFSTVVTLILLPSAGIVFSKGSEGIHDYLTCTSVAPRGAHLGRRTDVYCLVRFWPTRPLWTLTCGLWSIACGLILLFDWRGRISETVAGALSSRRPYISTALSSFPNDPWRTSAAFRPRTPSGYYYNQEADALLQGSAEYFSFRAPPEIIHDDHKSRMFALHSLQSVLPFSPGTRWVEIELVAVRELGPVWREESVKFLADFKELIFRYAPISQDYDSTVVVNGEKRYVYTSHFERRVNAGYRVTFGTTVAWRFPSLDVLRRPVPVPPR